MSNNKSTEDNSKSSWLGIFISVLAVIALLAVFGDKGVMEVYALKKDKDAILESNRLLEEENAAVREEIDRLKTDKRYIADIAKKELGMVGSGEVIYVVGDSK